MTRISVAVGNSMTSFCENLVQLHTFKERGIVWSAMFRDVDFRLMS